MKQTLLLFLSVDRLHVQLMSGGKIELQREFTDSMEGHEDFSAFVKITKCPTYLLTDMIEEDFRHEVVPHLVGKSRTALLQRKFDQFYRGTPFHQATLLQRQKTGRRDDSVLFSALTNPSLITPWLNIMMVQQTPLCGIYSVPQISAPLVKNHPSKHLLLISWERYSGLRQTYFSDHRLQISRLTPVNAEQTFNNAVVKELARTYQYLKSLSLLPAGQILDVRILCHANDLSELKSILPKGADMHYDFANIEEVGRQLKIGYRFPDSDASQIFLHQLATSRPKSNYANAEHTHFHTLWKMRIAFNWSSGVLLLASILWAVTAIWQSSGNKTETETLRLQTQRTLKEVQSITQGFPVGNVPAMDMKSGVTIMRRLDQYQSVPHTVLRPISLALDRFPLVKLSGLDWKTSANEPAADNVPTDIPAQVITLKGNLHGMNNDYRAALTYLDSLQIELEKNGYQATILTKPLDVSPSGSLADQHQALENRLAFSLKLIWRPSL